MKENIRHIGFNIKQAHLSDRRSARKDGTPYSSIQEANDTIGIYKAIGLDVFINDGTGLKRYYYDEELNLKEMSSSKSTLQEIVSNSYNPSKKIDVNFLDNNFSFFGSFYNNLTQESFLNKINFNNNESDINKNGISIITNYSRQQLLKNSEFSITNGKNFLIGNTDVGFLGNTNSELESPNLGLFGVNKLEIGLKDIDILNGSVLGGSKRLGKLIFSLEDQTVKFKDLREIGHRSGIEYDEVGYEESELKDLSLVTKKFVKNQIAGFSSTIKEIVLNIDGEEIELESFDESVLEKLSIYVDSLGLESKGKLYRFIITIGDKKQVWILEEIGEGIIENSISHLKLLVNETRDNKKTTSSLENLSLTLSQIGAMNWDEADQKLLEYLNTNNLIIGKNNQMSSIELIDDL